MCVCMRAWACMRVHTCMCVVVLSTIPSNSPLLEMPTELVELTGCEAKVVLVPAGPFMVGAY